MPSLSPKENFLKAVRHEEYEYVPYGGVDMVRVDSINAPEKGAADKGQIDGFGVHWVATDFAVGGLIPEPGKFILKDVTRWKKDITIPNLNDYDWEKWASEKLTFDMDRIGSGFAASCGVWERIAALMGFEEAMIAMVEEPEAVNDLFTAITDYKIALAEKVKKYYKTVVFTNHDDIATERNLFMSPDVFRDQIMPHHTRLHAAVRNLDMIPIQHVCGKAEACIDYYKQSGAHGWSAVQPTNDIAGLLDKYQGSFTLEGGFNGNGKPGMSTATVPEVVAEVERCFKEYGDKKGWIFAGGPLATKGDAKVQERSAKIRETVDKLRFAGK